MIINKIKQKKLRNAGIDIIRLIGMYNIIITHILYLYNKGGMVKYNKYSTALTKLHIFCSWHNNGFALISGVVGYKSFKYSNLLYLWMEVLFYSVSINIYFKLFGRDSYITYDLSKEFFPIIFKRYWYFSSYFGMYLFLPAINKGISLLTKSELKLMVISTLGLFVFWRDIKNPQIDVFNMNQGCSLIWLLTYYVTGAYIGKNQYIYLGKKKYIYCLIYFLIYLLSNYLFIFVHNKKLHLGKLCFQEKIIFFLKQMLTERYDSILKVIISISVCLFFLQINYNIYVNKIISFAGPLVFGIYLIHNNSLVKKNIIKFTFDNEPDNISLTSVIFLISLKAFKIFISCIVIDYFRYLLFSLLKLKNLCILIETKLRKIFC